MTQRLLSLAQLVALPVEPPRFLQIAAEVGCQGVGLRLLPSAPGGVHHALAERPELLRETLAAVRDTGVRVLDLEVVRLGADFSLEAWRRFLEIGEQLGGRHVLVAGDDPDDARLTDAFARLCEAAAAHGLTADLECMPWTAVADVRTAARVVAAADQPNGGVLVDALHFARSASTLAEVAALPRARLNYVQVCDGRVPGPDTVEAMIFDARCERLLPGEGGIDLAGLLGALPDDLPISIEIPSESRARELGHAAWARQAVEATRRLLARLPPRA